jgi:hypothetical protein
MLRWIAADYEELPQSLQLLGQFVILMKAGAALGVDVTR